MSDERDRRDPAETDGDQEKISDVEAHKLASRMGEAEEKRDKIAQTDDDADVEGHVLRPKPPRWTPRARLRPRLERPGQPGLFRF